MQPWSHKNSQRLTPIALLVLALAGTAACRSWQGTAPDAAVVSIPKGATLHYVDGESIGRFRGRDGRSFRLDPGPHTLGFVVVHELGDLGSVLTGNTNACYSSIRVEASRSYRILVEYLNTDRPRRHRAKAPWFKASIADFDSGRKVGSSYCATPPESKRWRTCRFENDFPEPRSFFTPEYPDRAFMSGQSGWLTVSGVISEEGSLEGQAEIVDSSDRALFARPPIGGAVLFGGASLAGFWSFDPEVIAALPDRRFRLRCEYRHPAQAAE